MIDPALADLDNVPLPQLREFLALDETDVEERPPEGISLDYKRDLKELGDPVTAFANTFGGIIIVGVDETDGRPVSLQGFDPGKGDLKTKIISSIRNSVHPMPRVEIGVVRVSEDPSRAAAIVRVAEGDYPPYMWTFNHKNKISVRVEDACNHASPLELEGLLTRRASNRSRSYVWAEQAGAVLKPRNTNRVDATVYARISIRPVDPLSLTLHRGLERTIVAAINQETLIQPTLLTRESTYDEYSQPAYENGEYLRLWRVHQNGTVEFALPLGVGGQIHLASLSYELLRNIRAARRILEGCGWLGEVLANSAFHLGSTAIRSGAAPNYKYESLRGVTFPREGISGQGSTDTQVLSAPVFRAAAPYLARCLHSHLRRQRGADVDVDVLERSLTALHDEIEDDR